MMLFKEIRNDVFNLWMIMWIIYGWILEADKI